MNIGNLFQSAAKAFASSSFGVDTGAPRRFTEQAGQWLGHLSKNMALKWAPNLVDPVLCSFCEEDAVSDCIACGDPSCIAHAHISHRADVVCDECVAKLLAASPKKARRRRRQAERPVNSPEDPVDAAFQFFGFSVGPGKYPSWEELNSVYRAKAAASHPDRATGAKRAQAESQMKAINAAYEVLKNYYQKRGAA